MSIADSMTDSSNYLFTTAAIRDKSTSIVDLCKAGETHFTLNENLLSTAADFVIDIIRSRYPDLNVPYHSRWRHFEVGNQTQLKEYNALIKNKSDIEKAKIGLDLILPSVLVDAGAGAKWQYESSNSVTIGRSEGLALASLDGFLSGAFSQDGKLLTDAQGLKKFSTEKFCELFKVNNDNPMLGVEGRVGLLNSLATTLEEKKSFFPNKRPGDLVDYIIMHHGKTVPADNVLAIILQSLGGIWPGRLEYQELNLGDTWLYPPLGEGVDSYVPFHKLSQWISYSVIETLEKNGFNVTGLDKLTGLAEYRNGGLMLDFGLISLRNASDADQPWHPSTPIIVEWRALTIYLLDRLGELIQQKLNLTAQEFPLAKVLEGGTWMAGRQLANEKRENSEPPIRIVSDGTVF